MTEQTAFEPTGRISLLTKLIAARGAIEPIEKSGRNSDDNFDYVEAVKVTEEANRVLTERGILVLPSVTSTVSKFTERGVMTKVEVTYEVVDAETGYSFEKQGIGHGFDLQGDRAVYKAQTGATKYFLAGLLSIPFVGRDPEDDGAPPAALVNELEANAAEAEDQINREREVERQEQGAEAVGR